jgi:hypothetical protein
MPNVEKFYITQYEEKSVNSFDRVLNHAAMLQSQGSNAPLSLSKLTSIHGDFNTWTELKNLLPFLRLKSLKTAEFDPSVFDSTPRVEIPDLEMDTLKLGTAIDGEWSALEGFLSNFKTLKCLRLGEDDFDRDSYYESEPPTLDDTISGFKHCLEELEIVQYLSAPEVDPRISSLADFQKLRKISLYAYVLFKPTHKPRARDMDILPRSLEKLELVSYDQYAVDQLLEILKSREEVVPNLKHIQLKQRVKLRRSDDRDEHEAGLAKLEETVRGLKKMCKDAGIVLEFFEERKERDIDDGSDIWSQIE